MSRLSAGIGAYAVAIGIAAVCCAAGCSGDAGKPDATPSSPASNDMSASIECTPTAPNGLAPPGEPPSRYYLGNGEIWTVLWPDGEIAFEPGGPGEVRPDGTLVMKFGFWRGEGARGRLSIEGRSLHRPGLTMSALIPEGYGDSGFQSTALIFPEPGCWEVTARSGGESLTFVTKVVRRQ